jgi:tyrosyl-tRNA synthetase
LVTLPEEMLHVLFFREEQTIQNASGLLNNVKRILGEDITISCNDEWLDKITMSELIDIISNFSVQKLLSRDNFNKRMESNIPIAMHEFDGSNTSRYRIL